MSCSPISELEKLSVALLQGAALELYLTPKPGLVDLADCGSHPDLSVWIMEQSLQIIAEYLEEITRSLIDEKPFVEQRNIAIRIEHRLLETLNTNTHKGYVFLSGMLLIARSRAASSDEWAVRSALSSLAESFFETSAEQPSNGRRARGKYCAGGIVQESIQGYPSVFEEALPIFRKSMNQKGCFNEASFAMLARLMQTVEDTTTLHRGGLEGLSRVKRDGFRLEQMIAEGENYLPFLKELNRSYIRLNLTIGGIADMLGISYGYLIAQGEISEASFNSADAERYFLRGTLPI